MSEPISEGIPQPLARPAEFPLAESALAQHRKDAITNLATGILRLRKPDVEPEDIKRYLAANGVFTKKPLHEAQGESVQEDREYPNWDDALAVAKFYWDNPEILDIPTRVVSASHPSQLQEPLSSDSDEKVLLYIDQHGENPLPKKPAKDEIWEFDDQFVSETTTGRWPRKKTTRATLAQTRPDVFLKNIQKIIYYKEIDNVSAWDFKGSLIIEGCDNLIIATQQDRSAIPNVRFSAENKVAILPGAKLIADSNSQVRLDAKGDIIQYPDSVLAAQSINSNHYIQNGGELKNPAGSQSVVRCDGEFSQTGGAVGEGVSITTNVATNNPTEYEPPSRSIPNPKRSKGVDPTAELQARRVGEVQRENQERLDLRYSRAKKDDISKNGVRAQRYDLRSGSVFDFTADAQAAGWTVTKELKGEGDLVSVFIEKPEPESALKQKVGEENKKGKRNFDNGYRPYIRSAYTSAVSGSTIRVYNFSDNHDIQAFLEQAEMEGWEVATNKVEGKIRVVALERPFSKEHSEDSEDKSIKLGPPKTE